MRRLQSANLSMKDLLFAMRPLIDSIRLSAMVMLLTRTFGPQRTTSQVRHEGTLERTFPGTIGKPSFQSSHSSCRVCHKTSSQHLLTAKGLTSALGHYFLFRFFNGKLVDHGWLKQSQVTAVSILLMTIFKSTLTA